MYSRALIAAIVTASAAAVLAGNGAQVATFVSTVDDSTQPYALYVPPSLEPGKYCDGFWHGRPGLEQGFLDAQRDAA